MSNSNEKQIDESMREQEDHPPWKLEVPLEPVPVEQEFAQIDSHCESLVQEYTELCNVIYSKIQDVGTLGFHLIQNMAPYYKTEQSQKFQKLIQMHETQERNRQKMNALLETTRQCLVEFLSEMKEE